MIMITKAFSIGNGVSPYTTNVDTLAEYTITFPSPDTVSVELTYESEDQISTSDSITVIDANGCLASFPLGVTNMCEDFYVSSIMKSNDTYTVTTTDTGNISYVWTYDTNLYTAVTNTNSITLTQVGGGSSTSTLSVVVTNASGCSETRAFELTPCFPVAESATVPMVQVGNEYFGQVFLNVSASCGDASIDWSTVNIQNNGLLTFEQIGGNALFNITSDSLSATRLVEYTVDDTNGITSNTGILTVTFEGLIGPGIPNDIIQFNGVDSVDLELNELVPYVDAESVFVIPSLTTAPTTITNQVATIDMTGLNTAQVGLGGDDINGNALEPGVFLISRNLDTFAPTATEIYKLCPDLTVDLATENADITEVVSVDEPLITIVAPTTLSFVNYLPTQEISVVVKNADGQTATMNINLCDACQSSDVTVSVCDSDVILYDYLDSPVAGGTWTTGGAGPIPATYDGEVTLVTPGTYTYDYTVTNIIPENGFDCGNVQETLIITKIASTAATNDECAAPLSIGTVSESSSATTIGEISNDCASLHSFSGDNGNLTATNYDAWYDVTCETITAGTLQITVTITGNGSTPLQMPKLQLWSDCSTALVSTLTTTLNSATLVYEKAAVASEDFLLQVLSDYSGDFVINTSLIVY